MKQNLFKIAQVLDQLMQLDIPARGVVGPLYDAARQKAEQPLTMAAVEILTKVVKPGDVVMIATGWVDQPEIAPECGESDGPPGAVALARALRVGLKAAPVIVTDACLVPGIKQVARGAGFQCVPPENLAFSIARDKLLTVSVLPFPNDVDSSKAESERLLNDLNPTLCIAIERGGMNGAGVIHNMQGRDTGSSQAKLDYLFMAAREKKIATLGIGDGGNEIGMGNIAAEIRQHVPYGEKCNCPCGGGLAPATLVDVLVAATVSNWGGYAIAAMLAASVGNLDVANNGKREKRVLTAAADAGFHNTIGGSVTPGVDGCDAVTHIAVVDLMYDAVVQGMKSR